MIFFFFFLLRRDWLISSFIIFSFNLLFLRFCDILLVQNDPGETQAMEGRKDVFCVKYTRNIFP